MIVTSATFEAHGGTGRTHGGHVDRRTCARKVLVGSVEERSTVGHRRVAGYDAPDHVRFQLGDGVAIHGRDTGEGIEIVVHQHLAGDADHPAVGLHPVALLALAERAALELAALGHLEELRCLAQVHAVHGLEAGGERPAVRAA